MADSVSSSRVVRFGAYEVDLQTGELRKHGVRIKLQQQPFQVLAMLLEHPGELVTREQIREKLWPSETFVDFDHSVNTAVRRLRDALGDDAETPRFIETLPRRGYRFLAEITHAGTAAATPEATTTEVSAGTNVVSVGRGRLLIIAVLLGIAAVITWRFWPRATIDSIAVLPFANEAKDPNLDYLADGIPGRVIEALSEIPGLRVASRNSAFTLRDVPVETKQAAVSLNVRVLLLGAVRRRGSLLVVTVELVDSKDDKHLWGSEYTVSGAQLATLDGSIAAQAAAKLHQRLSPKAQQRIAQTSTNSVAYEAYLRGDYIMDRRVNPNFRMALDYFQKAIDADPNFALAYAGMAKAYALLAAYGGMPAPKALALNEAAADRALQLDPNLALAHAVKAFNFVSYHRDLAAAEREFRRALELNPNLAVAYGGYASVLLRTGRTEEAIAASNRGEELDPLWPGSSVSKAIFYYGARRFGDALQLRQQRSVLKNAHSLYARVYAAAGRRDEALVELAHVRLDENRFPRDFCAAAQAFGMVGRIKEGRKLLQKGIQLQEKQGQAADLACTPYNVATAYAALGDRNNMLVALDAAERNFDMQIQWATLEPVFDPYRSDPQFQDIVKRATTPR